MGAPLQRSRAKTCAPAGRSKTGNSSPFSQITGRLGAVDVGQALDAHRVLGGAAEAEEVGQRGFAFQNENRAVLHARGPLGAGGRSAARHEDARYPGGLALQADR